MDRPALRRLLADIEGNRIDCVVVYKIDRLSRSLLDFAKMMDLFERHHVAFVSTTQQFNSATSMGRLVLNMLLSFAQFERELISERTRDKIAATRRKGKWTGGHPLLGYDVDDRCKLVVNEDEAARVRAIFTLYLDREALLPVVQEPAHRGWANKRWTTRKGRQRGGRPFTKTTLHQLLANVVYTGKVRYKSEVHDGEHAAIIDLDTWRKVQAVLQRNGQRSRTAIRTEFDALLKGLLRCVPCGCAMTPAHTRRGTRRYQYYTCVGAQQRGWHTCPSKSVPAGEIERFVVAQVRNASKDAARAPDREQLEGDDVETPLPALDRAWDSLSSVEQARLLHALVQRVDYDGAAQTVSITLHPPAVPALADDVATARTEERA
jgi:site-specific DNA recombinase